MSTFTGGLGKTIVILGVLLATAYVIGGIAGAVLLDWEDDGGDNDRLFWLLFLVGGGLILLGGLFVAMRFRWAGAALIALGAVAGAVATFWSIVAPVAAAVLIVLAVWWARARQPAL